MSQIRKELVRYIISITMILTIAAYFTDYKPLVDIVNYIIKSSILISAFALPLGAINIVKHNLKDIKDRKGEWYLNIWLIFCIALVSVVGVFYGTNHPIYAWLFENVNLPSGSAMYASAAFFCSSAMYRAFKARNFDASLLLITCTIVMLMNAPIGETIWKPIVPIGTWITDYIQTTGARVFTIGVGLGLIALSVRYIFGREKAFIGERE